MKILFPFIAKDITSGFDNPLLRDVLLSPLFVKRDIPRLVPAKILLPLVSIAETYLPDNPIFASVQDPLFGSVSIIVLACNP